LVHEFHFGLLGVFSSYPKGIDLTPEVPDVGVFVPRVFFVFLSKAS